MHYFKMCLLHIIVNQSAVKTPLKSLNKNNQNHFIKRNALKQLRFLYTSHKVRHDDLQSVKQTSPRHCEGKKSKVSWNPMRQAIILVDCILPLSCLRLCYSVANYHRIIKLRTHYSFSCTVWHLPLYCSTVLWFSLLNLGRLPNKLKHSPKKCHSIFTAAWNILKRILISFLMSK